MASIFLTPILSRAPADPVGCPPYMFALPMAFYFGLGHLRQAISCRKSPNHWFDVPCKPERCTASSSTCPPVHSPACERYLPLHSRCWLETHGACSRITRLRCRCIESINFGGRIHDISCNPSSCCRLFSDYPPQPHSFHQAMYYVSHSSRRSTFCVVTSNCGCYLFFFPFVFESFISFSASRPNITRKRRKAAES